jgi:hypothetical protein
MAVTPIISLRIPLDIVVWLRARAKHEHRTLSNMAIIILQKAYEEDVRKKH